MVCVKSGAKPADRDGLMLETDRERLLQAWRTTRWIRLSPFGDAKRSPHSSEFPKENRLAPLCAPEADP